MRPKAFVGGGLLGLLAGLIVAAAAGRAEPADQVDVLVDGMRGGGDVAVAPAGQTVCRIDEGRGAIVAFSPLDPAARRDAVGPALEGDPAPVEIAFLDDSVLAAVCRTGDDWSLRCWKLVPGRAVEPGSRLQAVPLGRAAGAAEGVRLAVSRSGRWLAISGLPSPLPRLQRRVIGGSLVGPATERNCPQAPEDERIVAITSGPGDELVVFSRPLNPPGDEAANVRVGFYGPTGQCLLRLDTGIRSIRDAAFSEGDGLWAVGGDTGSPAEPEGVWRLDAMLRAGRQAIRPVHMVRITGVRAIAAADSLLVLGRDQEGRTEVRLDMKAATADPEPAIPGVIPGEPR